MSAAGEGGDPGGGGGQSRETLPVWITEPSQASGEQGGGSQVKGLSPAGTGTSAGSIPRNGDNSPSSCQGSFQESCGRQRGCPESAAPSLWAGSIPACRAGSGWGTVGAEGPAPSPSGKQQAENTPWEKGDFLLIWVFLLVKNILMKREFLLIWVPVLLMTVGEPAAGAWQDPD